MGVGVRGWGEMLGLKTYFVIHQLYNLGQISQDLLASKRFDKKSSSPFCGVILMVLEQGGWSLYASLLFLPCEEGQLEKLER